MVGRTSIHVYILIMIVTIVWSVMSSPVRSIVRIVSRVGIISVGIIRRAPAPVEVKSEARTPISVIGVTVKCYMVIMKRMETIIMIINRSCVPHMRTISDGGACVDIPVPRFIIFKVI